MTATGWPAIVTVPERAGPVVEATTTLTVPFPLPDERPCSEIQPSFETADHSHSAFALTEIGSVPPATTCPLEGRDMQYPLRLGHNEGLTRDDCIGGSEGPAVAVAAKVTDAEPLPDAGLTVSQAALLAAVQARRRGGNCDSTVSARGGN